MEISQPKHGFYQQSSVNDNGSIASDSASEFSEKDAIGSNLRELMEQSFKDKYEIMKRAYEERISQLSYVIQETCQALLSDELIAKMKTDPTSQGYIPSHISELLNSHVHGERERYVHDLVQRCAGLESANRQNTDRMQVQNRKIRHLESDVAKGRKAEVALDALFTKFGELEVKYEELSSSSSASIQQMQTQIADLEEDKENLATNNENLNSVVIEKGLEIEGLKQANEAHIKEIRALQEAAEMSARDLAVIEDLDREEQAIKAAMKAQLEGLAAQNQSLADEAHALKQKIKYNEEDVERLEEALKASDGAVKEGKQKMQGLMKQVEGMLAQEAQESNAAIAIVHEKMLNLRHKLSTEIAKEKRFSALQGEELESLRTFKDEKGREIRILQEDEALLREKLNREQQRVQELHLQLQESHHEAVAAKKAAEGAEFRSRQSLDMLKIVEERLVENERKFGEELTLAEQRVRVESARDLNETVSSLDLKTQSIRLHYQNELGAMQNQLRHSYGGKPSAFPGLSAPAGLIPGPPPPTAGAGAAPAIIHVPSGGAGAGAGAGGIQAMVGTLQAEAILKEAKEHWNKEKALLESAAANHLVKIEALEAELSTVKRSNAMAKDNLDEAVETKEQQFQAKLQEATHKADMQLRAAKDGLAEAQKMNDALRKTLAEKRHLVEDLQTQLAAAQQTISDNHLELSHHRSEHHTHKKSAQDILQSHQQFVREARSAHEKALDELDLTRKAHAELKADHEQVTSQLALARSRHEQVDMERVTHKEDNARLSEALNDAHSKHTADKTRHQEKIVQLEAILAKEKGLHLTTRDTLTQSLEAMKKKHDALHLETHSLREEFRRLQDQIKHEEFSHMSVVELLLALREYYHDMEGYANSLEDRLEAADIAYDTEATSKPHIHHHAHHDVSLSKAVHAALSAKGLDIEFKPHSRNDKESPKKHAHHHHHHHHRHRHSHHSHHHGHGEGQGEEEESTKVSEGDSVVVSVDGRTPEQLAEHLSAAVARCHALEGQVRSLTDELEQAKAQALLDHEQDAQMVADMKTQFDSLMKLHDQQQQQQQQRPESDADADASDEEVEDEVTVDEHGNRHHHRKHHHHHHRHHSHHHHEDAEAGSKGTAPLLLANEPESQAVAEAEREKEELRLQVRDLHASLSLKEEALRHKHALLEEAQARAEQAESAAANAAEAAEAPEPQPQSHSAEISEQQQQLSLELRQAKRELEDTKEALAQAQAQAQQDGPGGETIRLGATASHFSDATHQGALVVADLFSEGANANAAAGAGGGGGGDDKPVTISRGTNGVLVAAAGGTHADSPGEKLARVAAYESVMKGLLDGLVSNEVLKATAAAELVDEAAVTEQGNVGLSSRAQRLVTSALGPFVSSHRDVLKGAAKIESMRAELDNVRKQLRDAVSAGDVYEEGLQRTGARAKATSAHHTHRHSHTTAAGSGAAFDESVSVDGHSESSMTGISKAAKELLAGELEQSKQENQLLLELTKLEGDARVKTLISKLKATKKAANAALERLRQEKAEAVQVLEAKHRAEVDLLREEMEGLKTTISAQADSLAEQSAVRSSTLDSKLQLERAKRKDLIKEFEKVDQEHRITIEELENLNLQLEQRCERAELQVTKLRMDAIGKDGDLAGAFESGPHMSTEDNIIMRMFSPPGKGTKRGGGGAR